MFVCFGFYNVWLFSFVNHVIENEFFYLPGCNRNLPFCRGSKIAFCSAKEKNIHRWYLSVCSKKTQNKTNKHNLFVNCDAWNTVNETIHIIWMYRISYLEEWLECVVYVGYAGRNSKLCVFFSCFCPQTVSAFGPSSYKQPNTWMAILRGIMRVQGGPLPVINGVMGPL